ncbi:MAG: UDP-glucose 4-epimerase GalE [Syntrophobacterales bacterium]|nr:MAG: UDP-glucose 4-epimerase GalE [Syntrophobacterales bacterium]
MGEILITGGAGYIGSHIVKRLLEKGMQIIVLDNLQTGHREAIIGGTFIQGDIGNERILSEIFGVHEIDSVIHMAADCLVGDSTKDPLKYFNNNVSKGIKLLGVMLKHKVKKIVFSSSAAVYGNPPRVPIEEDFPPFPINPYGETKLIFEKLLEGCKVAHGLQYISLRYFNAAGADPDGRIGEDHHPETHLIPTVLRALLRKGRKVPIYGTDYDTPDGTCIRDYIHILDIAEAHISALEALHAGVESEIFNLGNGQGFSVKQIIQAASKVTGRTIPVIETQRRPGDPPILVASSEKIEKKLGWSPRHEKLDEIIDTAWRWHRTHPHGFRSSSLKKGVARWT